MDLGTRLAKNIAETTFEDLGDESILAAKQSILDTIGVMLAGTGLGEGVDDVIKTVDELGGKEVCTIMCNNRKTNPMLAVMANGCFTHSIDFDDVHDDAFVHPSGSVVPTALTLGEYVHASGKDVITAVAAGDDLMCRMGFCVSSPVENKDDFWMLPVLLGTFASAATGSKILGLDEQKTMNAFGIAYNRTAGSKQLVNESGALRGLYCMFPNTTGTVAAMMARNNVPGFDEPFNGAAGFFHMYYNDIYSLEPFETLGQTYENTGISIKYYPCCRLTNSYVDAAIQIAKENDLDVEQVKKIQIFYVNPNVGRCLFPEDERKNPPTIPGAKISLPFVVSHALAYRKIELADFSAESIKDPKLLALTNKVEYVIDESLDSDISKTMLPGRVAVELEDGTVYDNRVEVVYGHPLNRMTWEDLTSKFRDCASYAKRKLSPEEIQHISDVVEHLEDLEDISELMALMS